MATKTVEYKQATFSRAEAAKIAGVTSDDLKNWTRAEYYSHTGRRGEYAVLDLAYLCALRSLLRGGIAPDPAVLAAHAAQQPITERAMMLAGAADVVGHRRAPNPNPEREREQDETADRFVLVTGEGSVKRGSAEQLVKFFQRGTTAAIMIIDCEVVARELTERAGRPLVEVVQS
jgi:hypothetical protein